MLYGLFNGRNFVLNTIGIVIFVVVMYLSCRNEMFFYALFASFVGFFTFIAIHSALYRNRTRINLLLQGKTDKKSRLILQIVNRIVDIQVCGRDEVFFNTVVDLQNDKNKLLTQNSQLLVENSNANKSIIEKNAIIQHINDEQVNSFSGIERSIDSIRSTFISGYRTIFNNINDRNEEEYKEKIFKYEHKIDEVQRKYISNSKKLKKVEYDLQYIIEKYKIFESVLHKILHDFEGKDRVSKQYIRVLVEKLCRDASITYSDSLSSEIYELLPPHLVLKGKGGSPSRKMRDATQDLGSQLKS